MQISWDLYASSKIYKINSTFNDAVQGNVLFLTQPSSTTQFHSCSINIAVSYTQDILHTRPMTLKSSIGRLRKAAWQVWMHNTLDVLWMYWNRQVKLSIELCSTAQNDIDDYKPDFSNSTFRLQLSEGTLKLEDASCTVLIKSQHYY